MTGSRITLFWLSFRRSDVEGRTYLTRIHPSREGWGRSGPIAAEDIGLAREREKPREKLDPTLTGPATNP